MNRLAPESPCRGFCTTALGDDVCKSCGRTFEEVCGWNQFTPEQKAACWERLRREGWLEDTDRDGNSFPS
jgi:predicted Fe-S protein YdhL (DUF1289 family)